MFDLAVAAVPYLIQIGIAALAVGISYGAQELLKPKSKSSPVSLDNEPTQTSTRGAVLPYLIGRRRIGGIFAWVGKRVTIYSHQYSAGGKGGSKRSNSTPVVLYGESGVHMICVGPAKKLHRIWRDGKIIFGDGVAGSSAIDSTSHPSGSTLTVPGLNDSFTIYWGEEDQDGTPPNGIVSATPPDGIGVASIFPFCCYVVWTINLGQITRWPLLEYDIETEVQTTALELTEPTMTFDSVYAPDGTVSGVNLAHAVYQLLFNSFPYGVNQDPSEFVDLDCLDQIGQVLQDEQFAASVYALNGQTVLATLSSIMQDAGMLMPWDPVLGKFRFRLIRPEPEITVDASLVVNRDGVEVENVAYLKPVDKILFAFADLDHEFKTSTVGLDDDGQANFQSYQRAAQTEMRSVISFAVAIHVAERRSQEMLARTQKYNFVLNRGARRFYPGVILAIPSVTTDLIRVMDVTIKPLTGDVEITGLSDFYGSSHAQPQRVTPPTGSLPQYEVDADLAFALFEVPDHLLSGTDVTVVIPRIRASTDMSAAGLLLSADDTTYVDEGQTGSRQTGGTLTSGMLSTDSFEIDQGPTFDVLGPDVSIAQDYSADHASWRQGRQIALIGDEVFFLQKVEALGGSSYRLVGLIRARFDSVRAAHSIGDKVYIFTVADMQDVTDPMLVPGATVYAKTTPIGLGGTVDAADVTSVSKTLVGKGVVPMRVASLRSGNDRNVFAAGDDIDFFWCYRSTEIPRTGAGMQNAGEAVGSSVIRGYFLVNVYDTGDVLKAQYAVDTPDFTYTGTRRVTDFVTEADFYVTVQNVNGGWKSDTVRLDMTKL